MQSCTMRTTASLWLARGPARRATVAAKVGYLLEIEGVSSDRILLLSFTKKAAEEMGARVERSSQATVAVALQAHVCAAKAGVELLLKTLAIEWGPDGVRCNCITPGPTDDTEGMRRLAPTEEARARAIRQVPLRRYGTKDELADLALFLSSDAASYMTGAVYYCDGGSAIAGRAVGIAD